jgi:hypothetical protein
LATTSPTLGRRKLVIKSQGTISYLLNYILTSKNLDSCQVNVLKEEKYINAHKLKLKQTKQICSEEFVCPKQK